MTASEPAASFARLSLIAPLAVLLLTAVVYAPAVGYGFVFDDSAQIVDSQPYYTWGSVPSFFVSDVWHYTLGGTSNYYRPAFLVWLMIGSKLFGLDAGLWHASGILLHLVVTFLVYLLGLRLTGRSGVAAAAALLFGVHPAHVEAVDWLSAASESLFAALALGAILCQLRGRRAAALLLFGIALFEKETAVVLPLLLAACAWMFPATKAQAARVRAREAAVTLALCACIGLVYMAARLHALGSLEPQAAHWTAKMVFATIPGVAVFYLRQLLVPLQYSLFYPISATLLYQQAAVPAQILVVAAAALVWLARQSKVYAFFVLLLVLPALPVFNLTAFGVRDFQHDRYIYLASAGLCLIAAMLGARWMERWPAAARAAALGVVVAGLAYTTMVFSGYWRDNLTLYRHAVDIAPDNPMATSHLADELIVQMQPLEALPIFQKALLDHDWYPAYEGIGYCYMMSAEYDRAEGYLYRAVTLEPGNYVARSYLAESEWHLGHLKEAETEIRQALQDRRRATPKTADFHGMLGTILEDEGDLPGAHAEYETQLREFPSDRAEQALQELEQKMADSAGSP